MQPGLGVSSLAYIKVENDCDNNKIHVSDHLYLLSSLTNNFSEAIEN